MFFFDEGIISEKNYTGSNYFGYLISSPAYFSEPNYNMLQKQGKAPLLKCMRILHNGFPEICYCADSFYTVKTKMQTDQNDNLCDMFLRIVSAIREIKEIGFFSCCNLIPTMDRIYIDPLTEKIYFTYLPLTKQLSGTEMEFENSIKKNMLSLLDSMPRMPSEWERSLAQELFSNTLSITEIADQLGISDDWLEFHQLYLKSTNLPQRISICVDKDDFVIGRGSFCDYDLNISSQISRVHFKISKLGDRYYVTDLKSTYGTFLNDRKLAPNQDYIIQNRDVISVANHVVEFSVCID